MEQKRRDAIIDKQETLTTKKLVDELHETGGNSQFVSLLSNYQSNTIYININIKCKYYNYFYYILLFVCSAPAHYQEEC